MTGAMVVFDCVVFAQAIMNDIGPAAACLDLARVRTIRLVWSDYVLAEIRELPGKLPPKFVVTPDRVEAFVQDISTFAMYVPIVDPIYTHPIDADDSHYVNLALINLALINLALTAGAALITSRDRHLLDLMDPAKRHAIEFRKRFPQLTVVTPDELLSRVRA